MSNTDTIDRLQKYVRAANYLSAAQIYLRDNFLLRDKLEADHIKARLLGHWGSCPGINFLYAHLNRLIIENNIDMMFVLGPGHGFPALQSNVFLEGSLTQFHPNILRDEEGISTIAGKFSWPYGFPSHSSPETPGVVLEGGELGYSLSTSYGAVLDNPELIVTCLVGDGEAETGPAATAWHCNKLISPKKDGAVLPVLHLNGYKISGPTFFGRMSDTELMDLFHGYGYAPIIVDAYKGNVDEQMIEALDTAYEEIREIQSSVRNGDDIVAPRFPMIVMRTMKGASGIKELEGLKYEDNCLSHQVIGMEAHSSQVQRDAVEEWLRSYRFEELFVDGKFIDEIMSLVPSNELRMGSTRHACTVNREFTPLNLPEASLDALEGRGKKMTSSMKHVGQYLRDVFRANDVSNNFSLMSPDETYSNKLEAVFEATTRSFNWPRKPWDKDLAPGGHVYEMLSEHTLQGMLQGYLLTGRHGVMASYEAFMQVVTSMVDQYAKYLRICRELPWRGDIPSANYILTSSSWRQDHNGFSHQNPGFISDMLSRHGNFVHVYFPADSNSSVLVMKHCLESRSQINVIAAGKTDEPLWLSKEEAEMELKNGLSIWNFASDENPDIVMAASGSYLVKEALAAIDIAKTEYPELKTRFVNVLELSAIGLTCNEANQTCVDYFTADKPVIYNFHGYPEAVKAILFDNPKLIPTRFSIHGYMESGSTTSPFDMQVRNQTDRYHLVIDMFKKLLESGKITPEFANQIFTKYSEVLTAHRAFIIEHGVDPVEIDAWTWNR